MKHFSRNRSNPNLNIKPNDIKDNEKKDKCSAMIQTSNDELRVNKKIQYTKTKKEYQGAIKREKIRSWNQYCTTTSPNNPRNEVYILAYNKTRSK